MSAELYCYLAFPKRESQRHITEWCWGGMSADDEQAYDWWWDGKPMPEKRNEAGELFNDSRLCPVITAPQEVKGRLLELGFAPDGQAEVFMCQ